MELYSVGNINNNDEIIQVSNLEKDLFSDYVNFWSLDTFEKISNNKDQYIFKILKKDNKVIGYIIFLIIDTDTAELHKIAISREYQGQGLSKWFFYVLFNELKQKNITRIILEVMVDNISAIALYNSLGFKKIGIRKNYYKIKLENLNIVYKNSLVLKRGED